MDNPVSVHLRAANLNDTVLNNLKAGAPGQAFISDTLNSALTASLAGAATRAGYANLATLIGAIPSVDIGASKDLSIHDFVSKEVKLPDDPAAKAAAEDAIAKLSTTTTISDLLGLSSPLNANPIFAGEVKKVGMATLLSTSPALAANSQLIDDFINRYANATGSMADFWQSLSQDNEFKAVVPELQFTLQLGTLTLDNPTLVSALRARYPDIKTLVQLTSLSSAQWQQLITSPNVKIPASIQGSTPAEQASNYEASILATLKGALPGTIFVSGLQGAIANSTAPVDQGLATFLSNASGFDILNTNLNTYLEQNSQTLQGINSSLQGAVTSKVAAWQRVARVTSDFPTANALVSAGYTSAYAIASTPRASFLQTLAGPLGGSEQAATIYGRAQQISSSAMTLFSNVRLALTPGHSMVIGDYGGQLSGFLGSGSGIPSWQTLFGSLSSCSCTDCRSVLSAAAYFVDLLQFLTHSQNSEGYTPLDILIGSANGKLHGRRPDLPYLKLNCENTNTTLPYVDLVNEILEGFIVPNPGKLDKSVAHDTPSDATASELSVSPEYTNADAYNKYLNTAIYPPTLPFDRWLTTARTYLGFMGSSLYQLMSACQTGAAASDLTKGTPSGIAIACEYLGISHDECIILTGKDFSGQPPPSPPLLYQYYGYSSNTVGAILWEQDIAQIETFLHNTAIAYDDLVSLLMTRALNPNLTIMLQAPDGASCDLTQTTIVDLASSGPVLQDSTLALMHRLIRLWKKLGWAIEDLDKTMTALNAGDIDQHFLVSLAAVKQLQTALNIPLLQILSFWSDLDTDGRDSLFLTLFQNKAVLNPPDIAFQLTYAAPLKTLPVLQFPSPMFPNLTYDPTGEQLTLGGIMSDDEYAQLQLLSNDPKYTAAIKQLYQNATPGFSVSLATLPTAILPPWLQFSANRVSMKEAAPATPGMTAMTDDQRAQLNFSSDPAYQTAIDALYELRTLWGAALVPDPSSPAGISSHIIQILAALRINAQDLDQIRAYTGLNDTPSARTPLTLSNLSTLCRYAFLAQSLNLSVSDLLSLIALTGVDPFQQQSPVATLAFVQTVQSVQASAFSVAQLNYIYRHTYDPNAGIAPLPANVGLLLTTLQSGLASIANADVIVPDPKGDLLAKNLAKLLGNALANAAMGLINGTGVYSAPLAALPTISFPVLATGAIAYDTAAQLLKFTGPMPTSEETTLLALSSDPMYQAAVTNLHQQPLDFIKANFANPSGVDFLDPNDAVTQLVENPQTTAQKVSYVTQKLMPYLRQIQSESLVTQSLSDNLQMDPQICSLLLKTILTSQVSPGKATAMADFLALVGDGLTANYYPTIDLTGSAALTRIDPTVNFDWGFAGFPDFPAPATAKLPFSAEWTGWVMPQYSEGHTFYVRAGDGMRLWVNGQQLVNSWVDEMPFEAKASKIIALTAGQLYPIKLEYYDHTASAEISLSWSSPSTPKAIIPQSQLFSGKVIKTLEKIVNSYTLLYKTSLLVDTFPLTATDVSYLYQHRQDFAGVDPTDPTNAAKFVPFDPNLLPLDPTNFKPAMFNEWERLNAVVGLRNSIPGGDTGLLAIFGTASAALLALPTPSSPPPNLTGASGDLLTSTIVQATGWNQTDLLFLAGPSGFGLSYADFANEIGTKGVGLVQLQTCLALVSRLGISAQQLFTWATTFLSEPLTEAGNAADIQNTVKAKYNDNTWVTVGKPLNDTIREASKEALIAYILAHAEDWNLTAPEGGPVTSSDQLYELFLIDVDMSPCMLTSRIVQANAAIQLFVQRCLMNLEPSVSPSEIDTTVWNWMQNFRVWQAARQVFLYPENWMVPTLRDDKTPLFQDLENALLQNPITNDTAEQAYLDYLTSLNEVAHLDIRATYWQLDANSTTAPDGTPDATNDVLHVFGRTTSQPYKYYYRRLLNCSQYGQVGGGALWTPWELVDVDISVEPVSPLTGVVGDHLMPVVWDARLYLFWPIFQETADPNSQTAPVPKSGDNPPQPIKDLNITLAWSEYSQGAWSSKQTSPSPWSFEGFSLSHRPFDPFLFCFNTSFGEGDSLAVNTYFHLSDTTIQPFGQFTFSRCGGVPTPSASLSNSTVSNLPLLKALQPGNGFYNFIDGYRGTLYIELGSVPIAPSQSGPNYVEYTIEVLKTIKNPIGLYGTYQLLFPHQFCASFGLIAPSPFTNEPFFYQDSQKTYFVTESFVQYLRPPHAPGPPHPIGNLENLGYSRASLAAVPPTVDSNMVFNPKTLPSVVASPLSSALAPPAPATAVPNKQPGPIEPQLSRLLFSTFFHPFSCAFLKTINMYGIPGLLTLANQAQSNDRLEIRGVEVGLNVFEREYAPNSSYISPGTYPQENVDFGTAGAYSIYNWELFFHIPLLIATSLSQNQQFADAQRWFHYIFNPTSSSTDPIPQRYWNFLPFYECSPGDEVQCQIESLLASNLSASPCPCGQSISDQITAWMLNPFDPFLIGRMRSVAFRMKVVMAYLDNLIAWGDSLFTQNTRESINEATQVYVLAKQILGDRPVQIPQRGTIQDYTYNDLINLFGVGEFSDPLVLIENDVPNLTSSNAPASPGLAAALSMSSHVLYFCVPPNDILLGYWDTVDDRLYKIRHCMNIQGQVEQLALFAPPISPALLVAAAAAGVDLSSVLSNINAGTPFYRFNLMVQKALELCAEVRSLGAALLSALEKKDAEALSLLRATQETSLLQAMQQLKQSAVQAAQADVAALQAGLQVATDRQQYYNGLIQTGQTAPETQQANMLIQSGTNLSNAQPYQMIAAGLGALPGVLIGAAGISSPVAEIAPIDTAALVAAANALGTYFSTQASENANQASQAGLQAQWGRRSQEWAFQLQSVTDEIAQINEQIGAANIRLQMAQEDQSNLNLQIQNAQAVQDFLSGKYTNTQLYSWMVGQISTVFFQCYQMAYDLATQAEAAFRFERGLATSGYIQFGYWDSLKKGLLSGERLYADLKRMEIAYLETDVREYEISKSISLILFDPWALIALKETGLCTVSLPEAFFDLDYPGHYFRRLKTVSLAIPCVTGPYTSVNCTLTMLNSKVRVDSIASSKTDYASEAHFITNYAATQSIATSTAQNDSGLFQVNFQDARYLPFEGAGVISTWQIELPQDCNAFDFESISDVVLNLKYTSRYGGDNLRSIAWLAASIPTPPAQATTSGNLTSFPNQSDLRRLFSLKHEFPTEWYKFLNPADTATSQSMQIPLGAERFPFQYRQMKRQISEVELFLIFKSAQFQTDYTGGTGSTGTGNQPLKLHLGPPAISNPPSATLTSSLQFLGGLAHGSIAQPQQPAASGGSPPVWMLSANNTDIATINTNLQNVVSTGGSSYAHLNPAAINDVLMLCHYSVSSK